MSSETNWKLAKKISESVSHSLYSQEISFENQKNYFGDSDPGKELTETPNLKSSPLQNFRNCAKNFPEENNSDESGIMSQSEEGIFDIKILSPCKSPKISQSQNSDVGIEEKSQIRSNTRNPKVRRIRDNLRQSESQENNFVVSFSKNQDPSPNDKIFGSQKSKDVFNLRPGDSQREIFYLKKTCQSLFHSKNVTFYKSIFERKINKPPTQVKSCRSLNILRSNQKESLTTQDSPPAHVDLANIPNPKTRCNAHTVTHPSYISNLNLPNLIYPSQTRSRVILNTEKLFQRTPKAHTRHPRDRIISSSAREVDTRRVKRLLLSEQKSASSLLNCQGKASKQSNPKFNPKSDKSRILDEFGEKNCTDSFPLHDDNDKNNHQHLVGLKRSFTRAFEFPSVSLAADFPLHLNVLEAEPECHVRVGQQKDQIQGVRKNEKVLKQGKSRSHPLPRNCLQEKLDHSCSSILRKIVNQIRK